MKLSQIVKVLICLIVISGSGYTAVKGPNYDDIRALGMGNTTIPVTTDRTAIFHNPAGLALIQDYVQFSFSPLAVSIDGVFFQLLRQMYEHGDKLSDFDKIDKDFIDMINKYDGNWVGFAYIPEISFAAKYIGFGMYTVLPIGIRIESGHLIPKLALRAQRDLVFTLAAGFPLFNDKNCWGVSIEYLQRTPLDITMTTYTETFKLFNEISDHPLQIIGDYSKIKHGFSLDVGFMHNLFHGFRLAWGIKDVFGVVGGDIVSPPQLDLGCAYYFPQVKKVKEIRNLIVAFEITSLFGVEPVTEKYEQFGKKIHLGAELDMHYAALRLGLSQGYPTVGLGLRFGLFKVDYAFFTEEIGYYAGQLPKRLHNLSLGIEFTLPSQEPGVASIRLGNLYNRAMNLFSQGKYYDAFLIYAKILVNYPRFFKNDWVQLYLSLCQEHMDMRETSKENYIELRENYPKSKAVPYAALGVMRIHYRNNNSEGVAKLFEYLNIAKDVPDSLKYHACYYQGQMHLQNGEHQKAIELFKRIPKNHPEYVFAQHSLAVAYVVSDSLSLAVSALYKVIQMTPKTKIQEEIINRSYVFLGYIFFEGLEDKKRQLSNAVYALRKVPVSSYYYEDALLGLAWCGAMASRWTDCLESCEALKTASNKPVIHCEALLLKGYVKIINEKYDKALDILTSANEQIKNLTPPSETRKNAATLEYTNKRTVYDTLSLKVNELAFAKKSPDNAKRIDSLRAPQADYQNNLKELTIFLDEFTRRSFFARNINNLHADIEFALLKVEKILNQQSIKSTLEKAVKKAQQIDDEMKKLEDELKDLEKEEEVIDTLKEEKEEE